MKNEELLIDLRRKIHESKAKIKNLKDELAVYEDTVAYLSNPSSLYSVHYFKEHQKRKPRWMVPLGQKTAETLKIKSCVDFGCGIGSFLHGLKKSGVDRIAGYDFSYESLKNFVDPEICNFVTFGDVSLPIECGKFDCSVSIEVAEHICPHQSTQFLDNLAKASLKWVVLTAASPSRGGTGHINCRPKSFWISLAESRGLCFSPADTKMLEDVWRQAISPWGERYKYVVKHLMVFRVKETI